MLPRAGHDRLRLESRHTGEVLELRRVKLDGQLALEIRGTLPPHRSGPPLHVHRFEDEEGIVTAGTLAAVVGDQRLNATAGERVRLPHGVPHRWWNESDETLAFEGHVRPLADLDRFLQAAFEVANAGPPDRPPLFYMAHVMLRHRRTQAVLILPRPVQAVLFRVVVAIGTLLGKYRGTAWPGCPSRCTGAPEGP